MSADVSWDSSDDAGWHSNCCLLEFVYHQKRGMIRLGGVIGDREDPSCVVKNAGMVMGREVLRFCCKPLKGHQGVRVVFGGNPRGRAFVKS